MFAACQGVLQPVLQPLPMPFSLVWDCSARRPVPTHQGRVARPPGPEEEVQVPGCFRFLLLRCCRETRSQGKHCTLTCARRRGHATKAAGTAAGCCSRQPVVLPPSAVVQDGQAGLVVSGLPCTCMHLYGLSGLYVGQSLAAAGRKVVQGQVSGAVAYNACDRATHRRRLLFSVTPDNQGGRRVLGSDLRLGQRPRLRMRDCWRQLCFSPASPAGAGYYCAAACVHP